MAETLTNARFFFESDVHSWLFNKFDTIEKKSFFDNCSFCYDIIDQPFYCAVSSGEDHIDIKLYVRNEMGAFLENPDLGITFSTKGEKSKVTANTGRLGGNPGEMIMLFYKAAVILGMQIEEQGLVDDYADMNTDEEGVLVSLNDDALLFEHVAGKERPAMACTTLFGGMQMARPYQNEIMDSWMDEMLPLEEKIELAEDGDEDMMEQLAMAYLNGDDEVDVDPEKAVYWFTRLAELDNATAQFNLGLLCAKGFGMERNFETAVNWLKKAAENGDDDAPALIEKLKKAVTAEKIVSTGDAQAQADLAEVYMFIGNSLGQADPDADYAIALRYAQKAAAQNNGDGLWALALAYEHGRGVEQDVDKAIECYRKGAELGHAPSQHSLACYYFRGDVLEEDQEKAFALCMKAAEQGYGLAMRDIGRAYQFGNGVEDDMSLAIKWYEKALEVINDPELEQKVAVFKMMEESGSFAEDFDEEDDEGDGDWTPPAGYMEAMEAFMEAEEYENELADEGVILDAPRPGNGVMHLSPEGFPRIALKADEGDERAIAILTKMRKANEI